MRIAEESRELYPKILSLCAGSNLAFLIRAIDHSTRIRRSSQPELSPLPGGALVDSGLFERRLLN